MTNYLNIEQSLKINNGIVYPYVYITVLKGYKAMKMANCLVDEQYNKLTA